VKTKMINKVKNKIDKPIKTKIGIIEGIKEE
jgi:hypothetical protein